MGEEKNKPVWQKALGSMLQRARRKANNFLAEMDSPEESPHVAKPWAPWDETRERWAAEKALDLEDITNQSEVLDIVPHQPAVSQDEARDAIKAAQLQAIETAAASHMMGGRVFPSATDIGGTPMIRSATDAITDVRREEQRYRNAFRTDEGGRELEPGHIWESVDAQRLRAPLDIKTNPNRLNEDIRDEADFIADFRHEQKKERLPLTRLPNFVGNLLGLKTPNQ